MTALAQSLPRPRTRAAGLAYDAALVIGGSLLIAALAQLTIRLPFTPVPVSGQTLGVLVIGTAYGWMLGGLTVVLYLAQIAVGLPFGSEGAGGTDVLLSLPSGGYLWGFLAAALLMGWLANRGWDRSIRSSISVMLLGSIVIYVFGLLWLHRNAVFAGLLGHAPSLEETLGAGLYPFIIGDTIKLLLAAGALPFAWRLAGRRG